MSTPTSHWTITAQAYVASNAVRQQAQRALDEWYETLRRAEAFKRKMAERKEQSP